MAAGGRRRPTHQTSRRVEPPAGGVDRSASAELEALLAPAVTGRDVLVEKVEVSGAGRRPVVRVTVDRAEGPGSLEADELADISRLVSEVLDRADPIAGEYTLEVSTPGVSRPLTEPRHWRRAVGRLVSMRMRDGRRLTGRVREVAATGVVVVTMPDGTAVEIDVDEVSRARVDVEFTAAEDRDEGTPDDGEGADNGRPTGPGRGVHGGH